MLTLEGNPLLRLYELFGREGGKAADAREVLSVRGLPLSALGDGRAQELVALLRDARPGVVSSCLLDFDGQPFINFTLDPPSRWFNWEAVETLADGEDHCEGCWDSLLAEVKARMEQSEVGLALDEEETRSLLSVLDNLAGCGRCGGRFSLELALDKQAAVKEYLLDVPTIETEAVSAGVWYSPETMSAAFKNFRSFLVYLRDMSRRPVVLFFYEPVEPYAGEFFKVLPLRVTPGGATVSEANLARSLSEFTPEVTSLYRSLRKDYVSESRTGFGDKFYLLPALFLRQKGRLGDYPEHELFKRGLLRSAVVYSVLAWLADSSKSRGDDFTFSLPLGGNKSFDLAAHIDSTGVRIGQASVFDETGWMNSLGPLAHDIGKCVGNQHYRESWSRALADKDVGNLGGQGFFATLERCRGRFNRFKEEPKYVEMKNGIELRIFIDSNLKVLKYELTAPSLNAFGRDAGHLELGKDPDLPYVDLNDLAKVHLDEIVKQRDLGPDEDEPEEADRDDWPEIGTLEAKGRSLWQKLIPVLLKHDYAKFRTQDGITVFIVSDDASFPWELVKPYEADDTVISAGGIDDSWWGVKFNLARWVTGSRYPASQIALSGVCCTADVSSLPGSADEVKLLEDLAKARGVDFRQPRNKNELLAALEQQCGVLHFACHGHYDSKRPNTPFIRLPSGAVFEPDDLNRGNIKKVIGQNRPLVFLNVCHSGRTGRTLTGIGGWAKGFIDAGCGAFIGCGWEVNDKLAAEFARDFYEGFSGAHAPALALGPAVRDARLKVRARSPSNSTGLAYYLYGNPHCKLTN